MFYSRFGLRQDATEPTGSPGTGIVMVMGGANVAESAPVSWLFYAFSTNLRNGLNKSSGIGKAIVELFSAAIWFNVWR